MFVGVIGGRYKSLSFNGATQTLSMADSDFGVYDLDLFSVSLWFRPNQIISTQGLYCKSDGATNRSFEITAGANISVNTYHGADANTVIGNTSLVAGSWYHILVHVDPTNATPADRLKFWINGSAETYSSTDYSANSSTNDTSVAIVIGGLNASSQRFDGLIYQPAFFSNVLVPIGDVYNAGVIRDITGVSGLYSLINTTGSNIVDDYLLATDWTNNNTVTISNKTP